MPNTLSKSIVFIAGTFISNDCWDEWKLYFETKEYNCIAPCWPYKDDSSEELRNKHPNSEIASTRLDELIDYFAIIANTFEEKPILIGHSMGGLIVQTLLQQGLGTAGEAIHSFPPSGARTFEFSFLKSWWQATGFFTSVRKSYMLSFKKWANTVANGLTCEEQKQFYYKYAIPESKIIVRDAFRSGAKVNFKNQHAPLLLTSGSKDKIISATLNYNNYKKYEPGTSITNYKELKNHNHLVFDGAALKEEAEFIFSWLQGI